MKPFHLLVYLLSTLIALSCNKTDPQQVKATETLPLPRQILLTWQQDPSSSITITWRTNKFIDSPALIYSGDLILPERYWSKVNATTYSFKHSSAWIHTVELTGLKPNKAYHVKIEHPEQPEVFNFRTLPAKRGEKELVMLAGGDSRTRRSIRREMNKLAIAYTPDLVIFDGDFINDAYNEQEWDEWFDDWHEQMITPEGRRIPVVPAIGNHEVAGAYLQPVEHAPFYYNRFKTPAPYKYYALEMGPDIVMITLDSDHTTEITEQTAWLDSTLTAHSNKRWKIVQYHVAAWPSVRNFDGEIPVKIRKHWIPVLEKHNVNLVIEAHDHAFKKTVPIKENRQNDREGIIYIGDGGWGAPLRETKDPEQFWWLDDARPVDHFWKITLNREGSKMWIEPVFNPDTQNPKISRKDSGSTELVPRF
jgi:acid phosphatase type 7